MSRVLTMSEIDDLKDKNETSHDFRPLSRQECRNLIHTIEALQQEIEQLQDENASIRNWNICEEKLHNELLESDKRRWELEEELEDANNYREGLEAIVDKLRAQAARMREVLKEIFEILEEHEPIWYLRKHYNLITAALSDTADYHNPADVAEIKSLKERVDTLSNTVNMLAPAEIGKECRHIEILKQAREALTMWNKNLSCDCDQCKATREALAEIDKTLGGKEDA